MRLKEALRLTPGQRIGFGHSMWTRQIDRDGTYEEGEVMHVTKRGGIRIRTDDGREVWVPYHHVCDSAR
jgi:hypothetical protein